MRRQYSPGSLARLMKLTGENIYLRPLETSDAEAVFDLAMRNKEFFKHYMSTRDESYYTLEAQLQRIEHDIKSAEEDTRYSFGIFLRSDDKLIGTIALSEVLRSCLQSCYAGYSLDQEHNGRGYMTEAVRLIVRFGFEELKLHRIEAGVMPHNLRSMRVLEKAGFHKEGIARKNVKINGKWEDHQVLAIINENEDI